jgi:hypothetical protein
VEIFVRTNQSPTSIPRGVARVINSRATARLPYSSGKHAEQPTRKNAHSAFDRSTFYSCRPIPSSSRAIDVFTTEVGGVCNCVCGVLWRGGSMERRDGVELFPTSPRPVLEGALPIILLSHQARQLPHQQSSAYRPLRPFLAEMCCFGWTLIALLFNFHWI